MIEVRVLSAISNDTAIEILPVSSPEGGSTQWMNRPDF